MQDSRDVFDLEIGPIPVQECVNFFQAIRQITCVVDGFDDCGCNGGVTLGEMRQVDLTQQMITQAFNTG